MGRFVTVDGGRTGPAVHVVDPSVPLAELAVSPRDVWRAQPSVRKVVDFAARNLASTPLHLYELGADDGRRRIREGTAAQLLARPAPFTTPYRFWHTIHVDGMLHDRWCFVVLDATDAEPARLFRIPPPSFRVQKNDDGTPVSIRVWAKTGERFDLDPTRCVFDSGYAASWGGSVAPIETIADVLLESDEARLYRRQLFANGARVSNVIERPVEAPQWDDSAWNRFKSQFASYRAGGGDEGGTPILEDGMQLKAVGAFEPHHLEVLEARKLTDAEVASFFHVAPELVGAREGTFANLDAFRQMLFSISLGPAYVAWEQAVDVMLLSITGEGDTRYVEAHVDAKLRGSFAEQAAATSSATGAPWMTRNEARRMRNLPPVPGGDDLVVPLNVVTGGLASPHDTAPKAITAPGKAHGRTLKSSRPTELPDADTARTALEQALTAHWLDQAERLTIALGLDDPDAEGIHVDLTEAFDIPAETAALAPIVQAHMQRLAEIGAWDVLAEWNPEADGWGPEMVEAWIARAAATNAERWNTAVAGQLADAIRDTEDTPDRLRTFLTSTALVAAFAAAFGVEALGFGGHDAARKTGLGTKTWHVTSSNPRPSHAAQNGETVRIDDVFSNGLRWPGDYFGDAADNANCSCLLTYGRGDS